jgi:hypothetical protein
MKSDERSPAGLSPEFTSRRQAIRLAAPPGLTVVLPNAGVRAEILDISQGGIGLLTNAPLTQGANYALTFRMGARFISCTATVAYVRPRAAGDWRAGLAFVHDEHLARVEQLVDDLLDGLVQFS